MTPSRHADTALRQGDFCIRYATLKAMPGSSAQEPINVDLSEPTSSSADPLDQEIQSRQEGDVIASYRGFRVVAFSKKRKCSEVN